MADGGRSGPARLLGWVAAHVGEVAGGLAELALPGDCVGCGSAPAPLRHGVCPGCVAALERLTPFATAPHPAPAGLPPTVAVGPYGGPLRGVLLAYKERGGHRLARPLGALLAAAVAQAAVRAGGGPGVPLALAPAPSTAAAARRRHGDHLARLTAHAVRRLRSAGWQAQAVQPLRALPRPDSASLDRVERAAVAVNSLRIRPTRIRFLQRRVTAGAMLLIVDDVVTTGATLAAVAARLSEVNLQVEAAAVVAATQLRTAPSTSSPALLPHGDDWANRRESVPRTRGDGQASAR